MGLRFCNEVVVAAEQIYPSALEEAVTDKQADKSTVNSTASQQQRRNSTLVNNQGFVAIPFVVDMGSAAPPSIRLIPCRPYSGAPIGIISLNLINLAIQFGALKCTQMATYALKWEFLDC